MHKDGVFKFDLPVDKSAMVQDRICAFKKAFNSPNKLSYFNNISIFDSGRYIEPLDVNFEDVICTTYFTTKIDPQRQTKTQTNSIEYIAPWYNSMKVLKLDGIVFYDNLTKSFIEKYQTKNIIFLKCTLGDYSLNDERFIIYYMFFLKHKVKNILFTDGNDVIVSKSPFEFMESKIESTIFVGRGKNDKLIHSEWNIARIDRLLASLNESVSNHFYEMAIYNAGIIGGSYFTVMYFLRQMCSLFFKIDNNYNNNMAAMHYVLYHYFYPNCRRKPYSWFYNLIERDFKTSLFKKIKIRKMDYLLRENINYSNDRTAISSHIYSGFPLNSKFKFFEYESDAFLIHK